MKGVFQKVVLSLSLLWLVACGGASTNTPSSSISSREPSSFKTLSASEDSGLWVLDDVDGEPVTAADTAQLQFQAADEVLIQDVNRCTGVIPVVASPAGLSLGQIRTRGCNIDFLISSNQLILSVAFRAGNIPYEEVDSETLVITIDEKDYTFHRQ